MAQIRYNWGKGSAVAPASPMAPQSWLGGPQMPHKYTTAHLEPLAERFWFNVDKSGDCWEWTAGHSGNGYAQFQVGERPHPAHRIAYLLLIGPIPDGLVLDHLCRNINCVNPAHLEPVTRVENIQRGENHWRNKTHCPQGHEYTPENTYVYRGRRQCRTCSAVYKRQYKARKRAQS